MKRILWFSPLPPAHTDIANYTLRVAPHLLANAEVVFCHPDSTPPNCDLPCKPISQIKKRYLNEADLCVYHLGNNCEFHGEILECAQRQPGIIVLHDRAIHEFFLGYLGFGGATPATDQAVERYIATMSQHYGESGYQAAMDVYAQRRHPGEFADSHPLYEIALGNALAVLSHNTLLSVELRQRFPLLPVLDLPLPYVRPEQPPAPHTVDKQIKLIAFGFIGGNRRLLEFVEAWAQSPWRERFTLDVAGMLHIRERFDALVRQHGLQQQVKVHGFVSDAQLDKLLVKADLALNLRYPTMGEASGSQLRIWANQLASVVTDVGWYGQLPAGTVLKIRQEHEQADLLALLEGIAEGRIDLRAVAEAGWHQLAAHAPDQYAADLVQWFEREEMQLARLWSARRQISLVAKLEAELFGRVVPLSLPAALNGL